MVRTGNEEKCRQQGHITWFTYKGFGSITKACFGAGDPPDAYFNWEDVLEPASLDFIPLRYYLGDGQLAFDCEYLEGPEASQFLDNTSVLMKRPDSLIFDIVKSR